mmetsp:Transcript_1956/g.4449  ORF Transcript_1956/g.4449 Transcript_1956/m.4449 type:complete len:208 (+) Transcript_1956:171-794(+)
MMSGLGNAALSPVVPANRSLHTSGGRVPPLLYRTPTKTVDSSFSMIIIHCWYLTIWVLFNPSFADTLSNASRSARIFRLEASACAFLTIKVRLACAPARITAMLRSDWEIRTRVLATVVRAICSLNLVRKVCFITCVLTIARSKGFGKSMRKTCKEKHRACAVRSAMSASRSRSCCSLARLLQNSWARYSPVRRRRASRTNCTIAIS